MPRSQLFLIVVSFDLSVLTARKSSSFAVITLYRRAIWIFVFMKTDT